MKTRYAFLYFNICEYKVLETYLRQMAKKGWALDSIFGYIFIFTKKKQPKDNFLELFYYAYLNQLLDYSYLDNTINSFNSSYIKIACYIKYCVCVFFS